MISTTLPRYSSTSGIAYYQTGMGRPLVLLHGVGLSAESWASQLASLANDHSIYALDLPGHGHSAGLNGRAPTVAGFADSVAQFAAEVVGAPVLVAGHSLGALVAIDFASRYADRCLGVAALAGVYERSAAASRAVQERAASLRDLANGDVAAAPLLRWFGETPRGIVFDAASLCRRLLQEADRDGYAAGYEAFAKVDGPSPSQLQSLSMPALFLAGQDDPNSTPSMSDEMARRAPSGQALMVAGARHMLQLTHPNIVNDTLRQFFAGCLHQADTSGAG